MPSKWVVAATSDANCHMWRIKIPCFSRNSCTEAGGFVLKNPKTSIILLNRSFATSNSYCSYMEYSMKANTSAAKYFQQDQYEVPKFKLIWDWLTLAWWNWHSLTYTYHHSVTKSTWENRGKLQTALITKDYCKMSAKEQLLSMKLSIHIKDWTKKYQNLPIETRDLLIKLW